MDGASSAMGAGAGIVIIIPDGIQLEHSFRLGLKPLIMRSSTRPFLPD